MKQDNFYRRAGVLFFSSVLIVILSSCASKPKTAHYSSKSKKVKHYRNIEELIFSVNGETNHTKAGKKSYSFEKKADIPIVYNDRVYKWIEYFTGTGRHHFERYLARSGRYFPTYHRIASQYGMPKDISYLSLIESGLNTRATSVASAAGPWQFIRSTGAAYGLDIDYYIDERRDIEKATHAAFRHLKDLHDEFGDWYLAFAAYNAGAGKIRKAINMYGTSNFWQMCEAGSYLRTETKDYVPKMLAATIIGKNPKKFGFNEIRYQVPLATEKTRVNDSYSLDTIADAAGVDPDLVYLINPELYRGITPPNNYQVSVPQGTARRIAGNLSKVAKKSYNRQVVNYTVKKGDDLKSIASKFDVSVKDILALNRIHKKHLKKGQTLLISSNSSAVASSWSQKGASARDDDAAYRAAKLYGIQGYTDSAVMVASAGKKKKVESTLLALNAKEIKNSEKKSKKQKASEEVNNVAVQTYASLNLTDANPTGTQTVVQNEANAGQANGTTEQTATTLAPLAGQENVVAAMQQPSSNQNQASVQNEQVNNTAVVVAANNTTATGSDVAPQTIALLNGETPQAVVPAVQDAQEQLVIVPTKQAVTKKVAAKKTNYVVKKGDTLTAIAARYDTTVQELKKLNGNKVANLKFGQNIKIAGPATDKTVNKNNNKPVVAQNSKSEKNVRLAQYTVKPGDTLHAIAKRNGTTVQQIMKTNGMKTVQVKAGAQLKISNL